MATVWRATRGWAPVEEEEEEPAVLTPISQIKGGEREEIFPLFLPFPFLLVSNSHSVPPFSALSPKP